MAIGRYSFVNKIGVSGKTTIATNNVSGIIYRAANSGLISISKHVLQEGERLDSISGKFYGDGNFWWVIAAASGIGWALQVPPGTLLRIPTNLNEVMGLL